MEADIRNRPFGAGVGLYPQLEFPEEPSPEIAIPQAPKKEHVINEKAVLQAILKGSVGTALVPDILTFAKSQGLDVPEGSIEAFEAAIKINIEIKQKAEEEHTPSAFSTLLAEDIRKLPTGKPYIFLGSLKKAHFIPEFWEKIIPPETLKWLKSSDSFVKEIERVFLDASGGIQAIKSATNMQEILLSGMRGVQERMHTLLSDSVYKRLTHSLKLDFDELTSDKLKGTVWEKIGQRLLDGDDEEALQKTFRTAFEGIHTELMGQINKQVRKSASFIPAGLKSAFDLCGLSTLSNPEFWIEITKSGSGLYCVTLHADDPLGTLPVKLPIEFRDVPLSSLGKDFWNPILRYIIWPEKGSPCDFVINDLYLTLRELIGKEGVALTPEINAHTTWEMVCSYLRIEDTLSATLPSGDTQSQIPLQEIALPEGKMAIPPLLFQLCKEMMPNHSEINTLREVLKAILGEDAGDCTDELLKELSSEIGQHRKLKPPVTLPKTFSEIFGWDLLSDLKKMRLSVLHSFKLSAKIASFVWALLAWSASIEFLASYFMMVFPGVSLVLSAPIKYVCALALMYGAEAVKPYVPAYLIDKVVKFFTFYYKIKNAVLYQIQIILLRVAARYLMDPLYIKGLQEQIKGWQAKITRSGELSFSVKSSEKPLEVLPISPPQTPSRPASPSVDSSSILGPIDELNIEHYLGEWIVTSQKIPNLHERLYYLNNCVRKLPLPNEDDGRRIWNSLRGRGDIILKLRQLSQCFSTGMLSTRYQRVELSVSLYSLYSIMRDITGFKKKNRTNTAAFIGWLTQPGVRASRRGTLDKMELLNSNLKIKGSPLFTYSEKDIRRGKLPDREVEFFHDSYDEVIKYFTRPDFDGPYHNVRSLHFNALRVLSDRSLETSPLRGFTFKWVNKSEPGKILGRLHRFTNNAFRNIKIIPNQPLPPEDGGVSDYGKLELGNPLDNLSKQTYDLPFRSARSQSQIVYGNPRQIKHIRPEDCNLLEMLDQDVSDQLVRVISLFTTKPFLLSDRRCMHIFETLLLDAIAIKEAREIREELLPELGEKLFKLCKKLLLAEEFETALFVAKVSNEFNMLCNQAQPDFRKLVREEFPSTPLSKVTLVAMYLEPDSSSEQERIYAIEASLLDPLEKLVPGLEDVQIKANEVIWAHKEKSRISSFVTSPEVRQLAPNPHRKVDLSTDKHGLHLLEWFQPLSAMEAYEKDGVVSTIVFTHLELEFEIKSNENGAQKAFGKKPELTSYFIAPVQKVDKLAHLANYLLLESFGGERKVLLPTYSSTVLFGEFLLGLVKGASSPFLEKLLCNFERLTKYYTYELNDDGSLESNDPEAIAYLATLYLTKGALESASHLFLKLKRLGNLKEFSSETTIYIEEALAFLALSKDKKSKMILLKLIAILEENRKIQSSKPYSPDPKFRVAAWGFALKTYQSYLKNREEYLSDIEELFLLKYIHANCPIPTSLSQFTTSLPHYLMPKICAERYLFLRNQYGREANTWKIYAEQAVLQSLFGESMKVDFVPDFLKDSRPSLNLLEKVTSLTDHPLVRAKSASLSSAFTYQLEDPSMAAPVDLFSLTGENIEKYFTSYYTILYEKSSPKYEKFTKNLALLHGRFRNKNTQMLAYILQNMAKMVDPKTYLPCIEELNDSEASRQGVIITMAGVDGIDRVLKTIAATDFRTLLIPMAKKTARLALASTIQPLEKAAWAAKSANNFRKSLRKLTESTTPEIHDTRLDRRLGRVILGELIAKEKEIDALLGFNREGIIEPEARQAPFAYTYDVGEPIALKIAYDRLNLSIIEEFQKDRFPPLVPPRDLDRKRIEDKLEKEREKLEADMCLPFDEIQALFLRGETAVFDKQIYLYIIEKSRMNAFFKRKSMKRVYNFEDLTEKELRVFLIFELNAQTLIWEKQYGPLIQLIHREKKLHTVSEMIMGLGKTDTLMPIANKLDADGTKLVINIRPAPNAKTATEKSASRCHMLFQQLTSTIPLSRAGWTAERLEALYLKMVGMKMGRELWDGTKEELQTLELRFVEEALDITGKFAQEGKEELEARLYYFQKILSIIRKSGKVHIDEAHEQFKESKKLQFPIGEAHILEKDHAEILKDVVLVLSEFVDLKSDAPISISKESYEHEIHPRLSERLGKDPLTRLALETLLPSILKEIKHTTYAASKKPTEEFAKPSDGNVNPEELSSFQNHFSAFIKTALLLIHKRLDKRQLNAFIDHLKKEARIELKGKLKSPENLNLTPSAKDFARYCPGYKLFSFEPKDKAEVLRRINESDSAVLDYAIKVIRNQIKFYPKSLPSNSHNFASMFAEFSGYTASTYNEGTYPEDTVIIKDPGTQGETARLLHERDPACHTLTESAPLKALSEILTTMLPNLHAIIDRGALFNGLSNEIVAENILTFLTENPSEFQGVVFYNSNKELVIWERGSDTWIPLLKSKIPPEKRITYFDQSHTYASDIPQGENARAIVTVGETIILEDLFQAIWRMRGLKTMNQTVEFLMTPRTKALIAKEGDLTTEAIIRFALKNQALQTEEANYFSDLSALRNVLRRKVLDKALDSPTVPAMIAIMKRCESFFVSEYSGNPNDFFGKEETFITPEEMFLNVTTNLLKRVEHTGIFDPHEVDAIRDKISEILFNKPYPALVSSTQIMPVNATQQIIVENQAESEGTKELEEELELSESLQQQLHLTINARIPISHKPWPLDIDLMHISTPIQSKEATPFQIFSIRDVLQTHSLAAANELARHIDPRIVATNNLILDPRNAFDIYQIPIQEALIIQDLTTGRVVKCILISAKDRENWLKYRNLYQKPTNKAHFLVDISTKLLLGGNEHHTFDKEILKSPEIKLLFLQIRLLRGDSDFTDKEKAYLKPYLASIPLKDLKAYAELPHKAHTYSASTLEHLLQKRARNPYPKFAHTGAGTGAGSGRGADYDDGSGPGAATGVSTSLMPYTLYRA